MADSQPPDENPLPVPKSARKSVRKTVGKSGEVKPVTHISFEDREEDTNQESSSADPASANPGVAAEQDSTSKQEATAPKSARKTPAKQQSIVPQASKKGSTSNVSNAGTAKVAPMQNPPTNPQVLPPTSKEGLTSTVSNTGNATFSPPQAAPPAPQRHAPVYTQFDQPSIQVVRPQAGLGFGGQRVDLSSVPPHQRALFLEQVLEAQQQGHRQPSPFTHQGYLPQNQQSFPHIDFAKPNFGPAVTFEPNPSQEGLPHIDFAKPNFGPAVAFEPNPSQQNLARQPQRRFSQGHQLPQQAPVPVGFIERGLDQREYEAQVHHDLRTKSRTDFVHAYTGGDSVLPRAANPNFPQSPEYPLHLQYNPRQIHHLPPQNTLQQPLYPSPQQSNQHQSRSRAPSESRPVQNHKDSMSSNPNQFQRGPAHGSSASIDSMAEPSMSDSMSSNQFQPEPADGRSASIGSMTGPSMSDSTAANQLGAAMSPAPSQQSADGKKPEGAGGAQFGSASQFDFTFVPPALDMPTPSSMSPEVVDGYTISHEQGVGDEYEYATEEETNKLLAQMSADMARAAEDTVALEPLDGVDPEMIKRQSVPFVKSTIFGEESSEKADTWGSLGGSPDEPRQVVMSHKNRTLTWTEVVNTVQREQKEGISRISQFADIPETFAHEVFLMNPNWIGLMGWNWIHKDANALTWVPTSGNLNQYIPRSIDTLMWYNQIITLQSHVDLWLPQNLNYMFAWFKDTPYGILHNVANPALIQPAFQPGRDYECTQPEAESLLHMTMTRFRAGLDGKKIPPLELQQIVFKHLHGWAPTFERLQVLDLMMQIDLVFWYQGLTFRALHPYTKYCRNCVMVKDNKPELPMNDGP